MMRFFKNLSVTAVVVAAVNTVFDSVLTAVALPPIPPSHSNSSSTSNLDESLEIAAAVVGVALCIGVMFRYMVRYCNAREAQREAVDNAAENDAFNNAEFNKPRYNENTQIPEGFNCSITHAVMFDPVKYGDHYYERVALTRWLERPGTNGRSPLTNKVPADTNINDAPELKQKIEEWCRNNPPQDATESTPLLSS